MKLTNPQIEILREIETSPKHYCDGYKPPQRLAELGLAVRKEGHLSSPSFTITDAGRAALAAIDGEK